MCQICHWLQVLILLTNWVVHLVFEPPVSESLSLSQGICYVSWVLANTMTMSSHCFWKCDRQSGHRWLCSGLPLFRCVDYHWCMYTHHWELMKSLESQGSLMVWHIMSDTHNIMSAFILSFGFTAVYQIVTFKVSWSFLHNHFIIICLEKAQAQE
jgi:hypothetical protein